MSVDKSLVSHMSMARARNVYTRAERLEILKKQGRLKSESHVLGLPKTRVEKILKKAKAPKEKKAEEGAAAPAAAAAAAPAAKGGDKKPAAKK